MSTMFTRIVIRLIICAAVGVLVTFWAWMLLRSSCDRCLEIYRRRGSTDGWRHATITLH